MTDEDSRGPVIRIWPSSVGGAATEDHIVQPATSLMTSTPVVRRYNEWGYWNPLTLTVSPSHDFDVFSERDVAAALWYRQQTHCAGIEFVAVTTHRDDAEFRTLTSGMYLVPVRDPDWSIDAFPPPPYYLYDGWYPIEHDGVEPIREALQTIEDTLDFYAYQHGVKLRWIVKYVELLGADLTRGIREVADGEDALFRDRLSRLLDLPHPLQVAVRRSAHWRQSYERQERRTDRFLALWLALESLLLVLYEQCSHIGLVVAKEEAGLTKSQRRALRDRLAEEVLANASHLSPSERVRRAYFEAIVPIRRQAQAVLTAVFESNEHNNWLFGNGTITSPAELRSKLVHQGWSEAEAANACNLEQYCRRIDALLRELIERVLLRKWGAQCPMAHRSYSSSLLAENGFAAPFTKQTGDFRISLGFLIRKGLIDLV